MKLYFLSFLSLVGITLGQAQNNIPEDYFSNPMDIPLVLSGSFGELRSNHFHSGLDIKTQQREGVPIYAPADGYISRIKVAHFGYGKALYVKHPNGYTTVYAHLLKYNDSIQAYVKEQQYRKESYEIELFPDAERLPVKKGEIIAYSGNTGSSGGPHLHFEIRDGASRPMNPMLFGIDIPDTQKPTVNSLFAYPVSKDAHINGSQNPQKVRLIRQADGSYTAESLKAFGKIGFGISTHDQQNGASNKNGTYKITSKFNGEQWFEVLFNKFSFDETRYLNRYIDYEYFETNKSRIQKLFRESNNPLSVIVQEKEQGFLQMEDGFSGVYSIQVSDFKGNELQISVPITGAQEEITQVRSSNETQDFIYSQQATSMTKGKFSIYIPAESLYEDVYLNIQDIGDTLQFHEDVVPIHKNISITADVSNYKEEDRAKLYLGRINYKGTPYYSETEHEGPKLITRVRTFGSYCIASDTKEPVIKPLNFSDGQWISDHQTLKIKILDKESGISSYRATINGKFILTEYEHKKDVLTYDFDDHIVEDTENNLLLIVVDNVGNSATFEATFFRKSL